MAGGTAFRPACRQVPAQARQEHALERAESRESVRRHFKGRDRRKVIFVPDRLINLVTDAGESGT
jgi:hypothetical protein